MYVSVAHLFVRSLCEVFQITQYVICQLAPATARQCYNENNITKQQRIHVRSWKVNGKLYAWMWQAQMIEMICNMICKLVAKAELILDIFSICPQG